MEGFMQEVETLTPDTPPEQVEPVVVSPTVSEPAPLAETPEEPSPEPAAEGEEPVVEEKPWWHSAESEDAIFDHETLKPRLDEVREQAKREGQGAAHKSMQPYYEKRLQELQRVHERLDGFGRDFRTLAKEARTKEELPDREDVVDFFRQYADAFDGAGKAMEGVARWGGVKSLALHLGQAVNDSSFLAEFSPRIDNLSRGMPEPTLFDDMVEKLAGQRVEKSAAPKDKRIRELEGQVTQLKAKLRVGEGAERPPSGPGGGLPMSYEAYQNRTPEEDAAMSEETHRLMYKEGRRLQGAAP